VISIVVPTVGRACLGRLTDALAAELETASMEVEVEVELIVIADQGTGPAAARNLGWRRARHPWVAFLDDDVVPEPGWLAALVADLDVPDHVGGVQGRISVPLPAGRRPTDWERSTAGLENGRWLTADMAYRVKALADVGGFDERFPRAYREDTDLAHRVERAGWTLVRGRRRTRHPVRPESPWVSVRVQRGNADDALLRRLYGPNWRTDLGLPRGRLGRHAIVTGAALTALLVKPLRPVAFAVWLAGTAEFAWARIAPGPRTPREVATMLVTSVLIPPVAVAHRCLGRWRSRAVVP
jgi:glycosyltransferase involved in cell wall biosynthesis